MNFYFLAYRDWALAASAQLLKTSFPDGHQVLVTSRLPPLHNLNKNDVLIFVGWSSLISSDYIDLCLCVCIHPSKLPKFRGGSPIQNQIIANEAMSAVTLFKMDSTLDGGPIYAQIEYSLSGYLDDILKTISSITSQLVVTFVNEIIAGKELIFVPQDSEEATTYNRRKPSQSRITVDQLSEMTAMDLYNMVRCLQPPYPEVEIVFPDSSSATIHNVSICDNES